jgi:cobalamin biosynthesis protein CobT
MRSPREKLPGFVTPAQSVAPLAVFLAALGCCATASASAAEQRAADVTITVIEDPEQLKEKVNTIRLPDADDADEDPHAARKAGHRNESDKNSNEPGDQQRDDAAQVDHNASDKAQSVAEAAKSQANEAKQQSADSHNDSNQ